MINRAVLIIFILLLMLMALDSSWSQGTKVGDQKAKYIQTMEDMRRISAAIRNYSLDFGYVPKLGNIGELKKVLEGPYISSWPQDAWGNDFFYQFDECDSNRFWLASAGSDGKFEGFSQQGLWTTMEGQDLILVSPEPHWQYAPEIESIPVADASDGYPTRLNPGTSLGIVRRPPAADFSQLNAGKSELLPRYDPSSPQLWQIDLRSTDISALDLMDRIDDLFFASFDSQTRWPQKLPPGFDPARLMNLGKNPGLGVRKLHQQGITGRGIGLAIIDQGLLVDHKEYKDRLRLYEEIHCTDGQAAMHGPAVASIALGNTVGVAPGADLYYIAETHGVFQSNGFDWDFTHLARSVDRILEINKQLPAPSKIRVISISVGWDSHRKGYAEIHAAVERAKAEGIFIVSTSLQATYEGKFKFHGLGRMPTADPDRPESYCPAAWWLDDFYSGPKWAREPGEMLLVPMDSRSTASPTGPDDYVFYREGGWSWCVPYLAGLYALACQVKPDITPEIFWAKALETGDSVEIPPRRPLPSEDEIKTRIQKTLDARLTMIKERAQGKDMERALAEVYNRMTGQKVETISEAEFGSWTANQVRETIMNESRPRLLRTIVNPVRLIEGLSQQR